MTDELSFGNQPGKEKANGDEQVKQGSSGQWVLPNGGHPAVFRAGTFTRITSFDFIDARYQTFREATDVKNSHLSSIIWIVANFHKGDKDEKGQNDDASADEEHVRVDWIGRSLASGPWQRDVRCKSVDTSCDDEYLHKKYLLACFGEVGEGGSLPESKWQWGSTKWSRGCSANSFAESWMKAFW